MKIKSRLLLISVCSLSMCMSFGCGGNDRTAESQVGKTKPKFETPQAAFDEMIEAMSELDMSRFVDCLTPDAANQFIGDQILGTTRIAERLGTDEQDKAKAIFVVLKKYGVAPEDLEQKLPPKVRQGDARDRAVGALVKNKNAFIVEFFDVLDQGTRKIPLDAKLIDVTITGDQATARMSWRKSGSNENEPIRFRKIDNGWLIDAPSREEREPPRRIAELEQSTVADDRQVDGAGKSPKIGFVATLPEPMLGVLGKGARTAAKELNVELSTRFDSLETLDAMLQYQIVMAEELLDSGVDGPRIDGLAILPAAPATLEHMLRDSVDAAHLVTCHTDFPDQRRFAHIGMDNYLAGRMAGWLVKRARQKGVVAVFSGWIDRPDARRRWQGLVDELLDRGFDPTRFDKAERITGKNYVIIRAPADLGHSDDLDLQRVRNIVDATLRKHNNLDCLVGLLDYHVPVLDRGITAKGRRDEIAVVGFGEAAETLQALEDGGCSGTIVGDYYKYGYEAVRLLADTAKGRRRKLDLDNTLTLQPRVVNRQNVKQFRDELRQLANTDTEYIPSFDFSPKIQIPENIESTDDLPSVDPSTNEPVTPQPKPSADPPATESSKPEPKQNSDEATHDAGIS